jgi:hypothetical protein
MRVQIEAVLKTAGDLANVHGALTGHFKSSAGELCLAHHAPCTADSHGAI